MSIETLSNLSYPKRSSLNELFLSLLPITSHLLEGLGFTCLLFSTHTHPLAHSRQVSLPITRPNPPFTPFLAWLLNVMCHCDHFPLFKMSSYLDFRDTLF